MNFSAYPNYTPSGVDWLGDIPHHWDVARLRWSTEGVINGVWGDEPNGVDDLICVRVADFDREHLRVIDEPPTLRAIRYSERKGRLLKSGDLLIEKSGGGEKQLVGFVVLFDHSFTAVSSNFVARLPLSRGHDPRYWAYSHAAIYARRLNEPAIKQTTGIQNLDSDAYLDLKVAFPPEPEQRAIADWLDRQSRRVLQLVAIKRTLIERLKEKRAALVSRTVTRGLPRDAGYDTGLDPILKLKPSGIDWIGDIPETWQVLPLTKYMAERADYRGKTPEKTEDGVFLVTARNVRMGYIDYEESREFVSDEDYAEIMRRGLPKVGDLLFTTEAPLGNVAQVDREDVALAQRIIRFRMRPDRVLNEFALFAMMSHYFQAQLSSLSTGSTAEGLKASKLPILRLLVPPLPEQIAIIKYLHCELEIIERLISKVESAVDRLREYRIALITAAITGKIDVRNAVPPAPVAS